MAYTETHKITLRKWAKRAPNGEAIERNIAAITAATNSKKLAVRGWVIAADINEATGLAWLQDQAIDSPASLNKYVYFLDFKATYTRRDDKTPDSQELVSIVNLLNKKASQPTSGLWEVIGLDGKGHVAGNVDEDDKLSDSVGYADVIMPDDWDSNFEHLFGVTAATTRVRLAIEAGVDTDWRKRLHTVLIGKPGCGKSDIASTLKSILGDDAVMVLDATATTSAGVIQDLSEAPLLPRII